MIIFVFRSEFLSSVFFLLSIHHYVSIIESRAAKLMKNVIQFCNETTVEYEIVAAHISQHTCTENM